MMFDRVFLSAPMVGLDHQPLSFGGMALVGDTPLRCWGWERCRWAGPPTPPPSEKSFPSNPLTSDLVRYMRTVDTWRERAGSDGRTTDVSNGGAAAMHAMGARGGRTASRCRSKLPVLMLAAALDEVVSTSWTETAGPAHGARGRHAVVPAGAARNCFMENDAIRAQVFAAFDAFITEQSG